MCSFASDKWVLSRAGRWLGAKGAYLKPELVKSTHMLTQKQIHTPPLKGVLRDKDHYWIIYSDVTHDRVKSI